jgi:hypothetical protein
MPTLSGNEYNIVLAIVSPEAIEGKDRLLPSRCQQVHLKLP